MNKQLSAFLTYKLTQLTIIMIKDKSITTLVYKLQNISTERNIIHTYTPIRLKQHKIQEIINVYTTKNYHSLAFLFNIHHSYTPFTINLH